MNWFWPCSASGSWWWTPNEAVASILIPVVHIDLHCSVTVSIVQCLHRDAEGLPHGVQWIFHILCLVADGEHAILIAPREHKEGVEFSKEVLLVQFAHRCMVAMSPQLLGSSEFSNVVPHFSPGTLGRGCSTRLPSPLITSPRARNTCARKSFRGFQPWLRKKRTVSKRHRWETEAGTEEEGWEGGFRPKSEFWQYFIFYGTSHFLTCLEHSYSLFIFYLKASLRAEIIEWSCL